MQTGHSDHGARTDGPGRIGQSAKLGLKDDVCRNFAEKAVCQDAYQIAKAPRRLNSTRPLGKGGS
jgi:hypothetical protein